MPAVFLTTGQHLLPSIDNIAQLLDGAHVTPVYLDAQESTDYLKRAALLADEKIKPLADEKPLSMNRIIRKTSERQACWVILAGVKTWANYVESYTRKGSAIDAHRVALFLGLGTVDCDDEAIPFECGGSSSDYIAYMLNETKPLTGLTLLNSSAGSHIAQLTGIRGVNGMFSPLADAGAQALIEAYFSISEQRSDHALVAAGSQKVTPWYGVVHRDLLLQSYPSSFPTEASAALVATRFPVKGGCQLYGVKRLFSTDNHAGLPQLQPWLIDLREQGFSTPTHIIYTGAVNLTVSQKQDLLVAVPDATICCLDQLIGYTGPVSALIAVHLAQAMLQQQRSLEVLDGSRKAFSSQVKSVLIVVRSFHGQLCYLNVGSCSADVHDTDFCETSVCDE